jgi:hypothetical protein
LAETLVEDDVLIFEHPRICSKQGVVLHQSDKIATTSFHIEWFAQMHWLISVCVMAYVIVVQLPVHFIVSAKVHVRA